MIPVKAVGVILQYSTKNFNHAIVWNFANSSISITLKKIACGYRKNFYPTKI
jgi:hypothetical protein